MTERKYRRIQDPRAYIEGEDVVGSRYSSLDELCDALRERRLKRQQHEI